MCLKLLNFVISPKPPNKIYILPVNIVYLFIWEARYPNGKYAGVRIERSGFEPLPGHRVVFLGKTLYFHSV